MKKSKSPHPEWAVQYRVPGTELRLFNGKYYLYEVTSKWDSEKKRAKKITGKIIGRISQEKGLIPSEKRKLMEKVAKGIEIKNVSTKEYGATHYLLQEASTITKALELAFPDQGKLIFTAACLRLMYQSPIKNMGIYANDSFIGEYVEKRIDDKLISTMLRDIGGNRLPLVEYMKQFMGANDQVLIDMTHMITHSQIMLSPKNGYKKVMDYRPQVNLIYIYSSTQKSPSFYRLVPGNIKEVKAFALSLKESGLTDAMIIGDKGFYSRKNTEHLQTEHLQYIIPLRRSSSLIDYSNIELPEKKGMLGFFQYEKRFIWYYSYEAGEEKIVTFLDEKLKLEEQHDYLLRIEEKKRGYTLDGFRKKHCSFGTLSMVYEATNTNEQGIYCAYKSRASIEIMFDAGKNLLEMDCTYMQNEHALEGWMFIHHIALQLYYMIYRKLVSSKLISKYSVADILLFLSTIRKIKIRDQWFLAEITKPTQTLLDKLGAHIT